MVTMLLVPIIAGLMFSKNRYCITESRMCRKTMNMTSVLRAAERFCGPRGKQ